MTAPDRLILPDDHLGLYVHVPFCARKCAYCDFASRPLGPNPALAARYLDALEAEIARRRSEVTRPARGIYIGGGTPTVLTGALLHRLWTAIDMLPRHADAEVSIEANPGTLSAEVLDALAAMPLTRVSVGAQSLRAAELVALGRIHTPEEVAAAVSAMRELGVQVNVDLMYGLPGQTPATWEATLRGALALEPEHLSLYALIIEEGTPLAAGVAAGDVTLPDEEEEAVMEAIAAARLTEAGYTYYEVSNAARPGAYSRHNLGYWLGRDYLGFGPSAVSAVGVLRWRNTPDAADYARRAVRGQPVVCYGERLRARDHLLERVMLGLRLRGGFSLADAERACGISLADVAGAALARAEAEELLERDGETLRLTPVGFPLANAVMARLMAEGA